MKTVRIPSRLLALFLALSLAYSLTALPALSEEGAEIGSVTVEISDNSEPAVIAGGEAIGETDGEGNPVMPPDGFTVETSAEGEPPAVTVVIDQSAVQEGEDASNVGVFMPEGSSVTVEAEGVNIVSEETGVSVSAEGAESSADVTVGDISAAVGPGIDVEAAEQATVTVDAGSVTVTESTEPVAEEGETVSPAEPLADDTTAGMEEIPVTGVEVTATSGGSASVTAERVTVSSESENVTGVMAEASKGGDASVQVGDVTVTGSGDGPVTGVEACAESYDSSAAVTAGEITVSGDGEAVTGVQATADGKRGSNEATVQAEAVTVTGSETGTAIAVAAEASNGGTAEATVGSNVSASGGEAVGVHAESSNSGSAAVVVNGAVTSEGANAVGVEADATTGGTTTVTVNDNVTADDTGLKTEATEGGNVAAVVLGNVTSDDVGVAVSADYSAAKTDIIISGTLTAGQQAVVVDEHVTEDNLSLTVWKIEVDGNAPTENDTLVQPAGGDNGNEAGTSGTVENAYNTGAVSTSESSTSVAADTSIAAEPSAGESKTFTDASIQYIIRVDTNVHNSDGKNAGTLSAKQDAALEKDLATGTAGGETYQYAHENDKVYLKIDVTDDSFEVDKAYGDEGVELELIQDEGSGSYYVVVPKGGGVYLSVTLKDKSQDNNENENNNQNNQNQNQEQNNQNQQQNQNQEQNNNPIPANAEKVENLIKVSVVSDSGGSNGNGNVNGNDQPPKNEEFGLVVEGTVGSEKLTKIVDEVVDALPTGEALTAMKKGNAIFASAFDSQNAQTLDSGVVNFKGAFGDAKEDKILVPSENDLYWENNTYTVVFSNGTVLRVLCTEYGVLKIPVPKDAAGLGYVVLLGTLESNKAVKKAKAIWDAAYDIGIEKYKGNKTKAKTYADAYTRQIADGKREDYANAFAAQIAEGKDEKYADYYAFGKAEMGIKNEEEAIKYADMRAEGKSGEYCQDYIRSYEGRIDEGKDYAATWAKEFCDKYHIDRKSGDYAQAYADKIADGKGDVYAAAYAEKIADSWPEEKAKSYAESYAESYADVYRAQIAGGSDEKYAKDYANAYAAQKAAGISDVYAAGYAAAIADGKDEAEAKAAGMAAEAAEAAAGGSRGAAARRPGAAADAQQSAANANAAGTTTEATAAAGGDAADTGSFDDDDLAALNADALNSILENDQNARNAQQSAATANAAGTTTEATSAAGGPAADPDFIRDNDALVDAAIKSALEDARNARQTNNANAAGTTTEATSAAGGDAADTGSFDDDDLAALNADALNSILENDQNARNAQRSAANANAAGTTEATTAAVNRGDVADNAQQTNNANALGVYSPTGDHSGALGD